MFFFWSCIFFCHKSRTKEHIIQPTFDHTWFKQNLIPKWTVLLLSKIEVLLSNNDTHLDFKKKTFSFSVLKKTRLHINTKTWFFWFWPQVLSLFFSQNLLKKLLIEHDSEILNFYISFSLFSSLWLLSFFMVLVQSNDWTREKTSFLRFFQHEVINRLKQKLTVWTFNALLERLKKREKKVFQTLEMFKK